MYQLNLNFESGSRHFAASTGRLLGEQCHEAQAPMFRAKGLGAENRSDAHRPTLTLPRLAVIANQDTVLKPRPRIALYGLGARFDFSGRKRCVDFGAIACHVLRNLAL